MIQMGCCILESTDGRAVLYSSLTNWAFGPVFESVAIAEQFCQWLWNHPDPSRCQPWGQDKAQDPRSYTKQGLGYQVSDFNRMRATWSHVK